MAKRLWIAALVAAVMLAACKSSKTKDSSSKMTDGGTMRTAELSSDPTENALLNLGIDGGVSKLDLNQATYADGRLIASELHMLAEMFVVEGSGKRPRVFGIERASLSTRWISAMPERSLYPVGASSETAFFVSKHYLTPLDLRDGQRSFRMPDGGLRRQPVRLPYTPTAGPAGQHDTVWVPSLGSSVNNKKLESFSLATGARGWGWRPQGDILTSPLVGGSAGDPKLYFVTNTGIATCLDARNYAFGPQDPRWEVRLSGRVASNHQPFLTADTSSRVGGYFIADLQGTVYCIDRITGRRRWTNSTGRTPTGGPLVFGNVVVVPTTKGLIAYDRDNVVYTATVIAGPDEGATVQLRNGPATSVGSASESDLTLSDPKVQKLHITFRVDGEVLSVVSNDEAKMRVGGAEVGSRTTLEHGAEVRIGNTVVRITDDGSKALWKDLPVDRVVVRVGDRMVVTKAGMLRTINAYTGVPDGQWVKINSLRFIPSNTFDSNLTVLVGDAELYTLYPR